MDKQQVQHLFDAIDAMNPDRFVSFLTPDVVFRFGGSEPVVGQATVFGLVDGFWKAIGGSRHRLVHLWNDGPDVAMQGEVTYTRKDGREVIVPFVNVFKMRGDKIAEYLIHIDNGPLFAP